MRTSWPGASRSPGPGEPSKRGLARDVSAPASDIRDGGAGGGRDGSGGPARWSRSSGPPLPADPPPPPPRIPSASLAAPLSHPPPRPPAPACPCSHPPRAPIAPPQPTRPPSPPPPIPGPMCCSACHAKGVKSLLGRGLHAQLSRMLALSSARRGRRHAGKSLANGDCREQGVTDPSAFGGQVAT